MEQLAGIFEFSFSSLQLGTGTGTCTVVFVQSNDVGILAWCFSHLRAMVYGELEEMAFCGSFFLSGNVMQSKGWEGHSCKGKELYHIMSDHCERGGI